MRTPAAQPRRVERLCQGTCPGRSRYACVPSFAAIQKATGSLPEGSVPFGSAGEWGGSSGRWLLVLGGHAAAGVGWTWDGHKPSPFSWDSVTLIPFVPRPTGAAWPDYATTAVAIVRTRPASPQSGWLPGLLPDPPRGVDAPLVGGVVVRAGPQRLPFGFGSPTTPWLSVSGTGRC